MREYVLDGVLDSRPSERRMVFLNIVTSALEEILDEICENVDGRFSRWERGYVIIQINKVGEMLRSEVKFPPGSHG